MNPDLDIYPAWGFDWTERWEVAAAQRDNLIKINKGDPSNTTHRRWSQERIVPNNIAKIASYCFPFNCCLGIGHWCHSSDDFHSDDPLKREISRKHLDRSCQETIFGPLLCISDTCQTVSDCYAIEEYKKAHIIPNQNDEFFAGS